MQKSKEYHYKRWLYQAPIGLILLGFGLCLVAESTVLKYSGVPAWKWIAAGTISLTVFNSGLCLFGDAILHRSRYERAVERSEQ